MNTAYPSALARSGFSTKAATSKAPSASAMGSRRRAHQSDHAAAIGGARVRRACPGGSTGIRGLLRQTLAVTPQRASLWTTWTSPHARRLPKSRQLADQFFVSPADQFRCRLTSADGWLSCDTRACVYRAHERSVCCCAMASARGGLRQGRYRGESGAAARPLRATPMIDAIDLQQSGTQAVWLDPGGLRIETVADWREPAPGRPPSSIERNERR